MNRSCIACAESKLRCDLNKTDPPCSRCLQKGWVCVRAERKKRARKIKETSSLPSPQTGSDDGPYKVTDLAVLDEQSVDLSFLDKYLSEEVDFLAQLADLENSVDMSRFTWTLQDMPSIISDDSLTQYSIDQPTCEMNVAQMTMNVGFLCPDNFRLPADYVLELEGPSTVAVDRLETYARLFFAHFHSFLPILHIPTFCLASSPSVLVRAVCFIGAGFENTAMSNSDAKLFHESLSSQLAKCCLHYDKAPPNTSRASSTCALPIREHGKWRKCSGTGCVTTPAPASCRDHTASRAAQNTWGVLKSYTFLLFLAFMD